MQRSDKGLEISHQASGGVNCVSSMVRHPVVNLEASKESERNGIIWM